MTGAAERAGALVRVATDSAPIRRVVAELSERGVDLGAAFRRALPFFTRRKIAVTPGHPTTGKLSVLIGELSAPSYVVHLATDPGGARAMLLFDSSAVAFMLDGVLGGTDDSPMPLEATRLSAPQNAIMSRVADDVITALSVELSANAGYRLSRMSGGPPGDAGEGILVSLPLDLGQDGQGGRVLLALSSEVRSAAPANTRQTVVDPRLAACLHGVDLEIVAELGRVRVSIHELSKLRVGDALRLDVAVGAAIKIWVGDRPLLDAQPTTIGSRVGLRVVDRPKF